MKAYPLLIIASLLLSLFTPAGMRQAKAFSLPDQRANSASSLQENLPIQVPVLVLAYYPRDPGRSDYLDPQETGWTDITVAAMQTATQGMVDAGQALISDATRYHGYKDASAPNYLQYTTYQTLEYFEAMPRGYPLGGIQYRPHYNHILTDINICDYVDTHGVKEVWIYGYHAAVIIPDESKMSSKYGDISNAYPKDESIPAEFRLPLCTNSYVMYNFTYQPGGSQAIGNTIHNRMHQLENVVYFAENLEYPPTDTNIIGSLFWDDFSVKGNRAQNTGYRASCGNTHAPPNTTEGYRYDSYVFGENNCETWNPDDSLTTYVSSNCLQWGCTDVGFYKWFMQNAPGYNNGIVSRGRQMRNWWEAMVDFNQFIDSGGRSLWQGPTKIYLPMAQTKAPLVPVYQYPLDGETLPYAGNWLFKVTPIPNSQGYLWGFFQNGQLVWENNRDEGTLSGNEYTINAGSLAHSKFAPGDVEVWVRAKVNYQWTDAGIIKIKLQ